MPPAPCSVSTNPFRIEYVRVRSVIVPLRIRIDRQLRSRFDEMGLKPPELTRKQIARMADDISADLVKFLDIDMSVGIVDSEDNDPIKQGLKVSANGWTVVLRKSQEILGSLMLKDVELDVIPVEDEVFVADDKKNLSIKYKPVDSQRIVDVYVQYAPV